MERQPVSGLGSAPPRRATKGQDLPRAMGLLVVLAVVYLCALIPATERTADVDEVARTIDLRRHLRVKWHMTENQRSGNHGHPVELLGRTPERVAVMDSSKVFVSVKTTQSLHKRRLPVLMLTWMQTVNASQVRIVTDGEPDVWTDTAEELGFQVSRSNCTPDHSLEALCCKSGWEYDLFYRAQEEEGDAYSWFCHFDDDAYVNMPALVRALNTYYDHHHIYIGHYPRGFWGYKKVSKVFKANFPNYDSDTFYYALGPAYCISKKLMTKVAPYLRGSRNFKATCKQIDFPDDAAVGVVIEIFLGYPQIEVPLMLNHLDRQSRVWPGILKELITIGYSNTSVIPVPAPVFSYREDPTRFLSYHCMLYPKTSWCAQYMSYSYNCLIHPLSCW